MTNADISPATPSADMVTGILQDIENSRENLIKITQTLVRIPSPTPPSDTRATVQAVAEMLADLDDIDTGTHTSEPPIDNLVATVRATKPGKRLVLNGHLDTFPVGNRSDWRDDPYSGTLREGKIYGRGSADMKGGVACMLQAFRYLAQRRDIWTGELVLALAGDEESMGVLGSQFLLDTVPEARGDAMLNADIGSPMVPRIGEKGMIWIDVFAAGKPAHGAHVHCGVNAIDAIRTAMDELAKLNVYPVKTPDEIAEIIKNAKEVSEPLGGAGEAEVMQRITVNFGRIKGGQTANLVPDRAEVNVDVRLPMGVSAAQIESEISRLLKPITGISSEITRCYEPT
ncbi:MAG: M20/M25/M40 family metallo-hydrolase, partial [Hyphomicrobiales bacterium]